MSPALLYPFILVAGALQALGNSMNAQLRGRMVNPWLAATVSFAPIVFVFATLFFMMPTPLPTLETLGKMPWYAPLGGVAGAVAVFGGLAFIDKVGAGPFNGLTLTANILASLAMDSLGLFGLPGGGFKPMPWIGGLLMAVGVVFIARATADTGEKDAGDGLNAKLLYPFIIVAGILQAIGVTGQPLIRRAETLASNVSRRFGTSSVERADRSSDLIPSAPTAGLGFRAVEELFTPSAHRVSPVVAPANSIPS